MGVTRLNSNDVKDSSLSGVDFAENSIQSSKLIDSPVISGAYNFPFQVVVNSKGIVISAGSNGLLPASKGGTGTSGLSGFVKGTGTALSAQPTLLTIGVDLGTISGSINTNAALGNQFNVTLNGNSVLSNPTNPFPGQKIIWRIKQDAVGSRLLTFGSAFRFGTDIPNLTLSITASKIDYIGAIYNSNDSKWDVVAFSRGY